jgi:hypothetical protein
MFSCGFLLWSGSPDLEWQNAIRIHKNTGGPLNLGGFYGNWFTSLAFVSTPCLLSLRLSSPACFLSECIFCVHVQIISGVHLLFAIVVDWHCFSADLTFHFDSDRDPDHTPIFTHVGKSTFFLLSAFRRQTMDLRKFSNKSLVFSCL